MKNAASQYFVVDKLLKIGRNLAWLGSVMFAVLAVGLEMFRQVRRVTTKRHGDDTDFDDYEPRRPRSGHTMR